MTLYLKYRPQKLSDIDIKSVRESVSKILFSGKIPHAFLFIGTKGTGKTSTARIVAKYVNCQANKEKDHLPCNECESCVSITKGENLDVVEIDAASHRGIDDIRSLRETIKLAPFKSKYKVYIIDECHMLTIEAANALLKTLEEPPSHVIFILATTNPEKLLPTILSRCTIINFTKATTEEIVSRLESIVKNENVGYQIEALRLIAQFADGSFRDAVKKLEQCIVENIALNNESISQHLFHSNDFSPSELIELIYSGKVKESLNLIENSLKLGVSAKTMIERLLNYLRRLILSKVVGDDNSLPSIGVDILTNYVNLLLDASRDMQLSSIEQLPLEIFVIKAGNLCAKSPENKGNSLQAQQEKSVDVSGNDPFRSKESLSDCDSYLPKKVSFSNENRVLKSDTDLQVSGSSVHKDVMKTNESDQCQENKNGDSRNLDQVKEKQEKIDRGYRNLLADQWQIILTKIRLMNSSTEALLRAAKPISYDGNKLVLGVYYKFHKERLESNPHKDIIYKVVESTFGMLDKIDCVLTDPPNSIVGQQTVQALSTSTNKSILSDEDLVLTEANDDDIVDLAKELFRS
ncbi:MAG: DNA polymerase III subunit gamma/tau [Patescibacteria group bacterium]|nr:DNA polymerase III subunit gamma/tau [Patescibacteria group bacterium]